MTEDFLGADIPEAIPLLGRDEVENAFNEIETELERLRNIRPSCSRSRSSSRRDPEMPFLEPQVNLNDLSNSSSAAVAGFSGTGSSAFRRVRDNDDLSSSTPPQLMDLIDDDLSTLFEERPGRGFLDPEDGRRSPYPRLPQDPTVKKIIFLHYNLSFYFYNNIFLLKQRYIDFTTQREREIRGGRRLASPDFPILTLRENMERRSRVRRLTHQADPWATPVVMVRISHHLL